MFFLDASVLAAYYLESPESGPVHRLLKEEKGEGVALCSLSIVAYALLLRDLLADGVPAATIRRAGGAFDEDLEDFIQIQVDACLVIAGRLAIRHGLFLEPAIQLAAALHFDERLGRNAPQFPRPMVRLVTLDPRLAEAAMREGLATGP